MTRTKTTVTRLNRPTFVDAPGRRIGNKNIINRRQSIFKIKTILPQIKQVEVKKWSNRRMTKKKISLFFQEQKTQILIEK